MAVGGPRPKVSQNTFSILLLHVFIGFIIMFNCCGEERDVYEMKSFCVNAVSKQDIYAF